MDGHSAPLIPEPGGPVALARPWAIHLLGVALAGWLALNLSRGWWPSALGGLEHLDRRPRPSPLLAAAALVGAFGLEIVLRKWAVPELVGAGAYYPAYVLPWLPYFLAYLAVDRRNRPSLIGGGWPAVRPAFQTIIPWTVAGLLVLVFPTFSHGPVAVLPRLESLGRWGLHMLLPLLLSYPYFLGTLPAALAAFGRSEAVRTGDGARRLVAVTVGVLLLSVWVFLPRLVMGSEALGNPPSLAEVLLRLAWLVPAGFVQASDRGLLWAPLASLVTLLGWQVVPIILGAVLRW